MRTKELSKQEMHLHLLGIVMVRATVLILEQDKGSILLIMHVLLLV